MSVIGTFLIALAYVFSLLFASRSSSLISSLFMLSICDPSKYYGLILTQGVVMGIGNGLLITPTLSIQSQYWDKRLGLALGIVQSGTYLLRCLYWVIDFQCRRLVVWRCCDAHHAQHTLQRQGTVCLGHASRRIPDIRIARHRKLTHENPSPWPQGRRKCPQAKRRRNQGCSTGLAVCFIRYWVRLVLLSGCSDSDASQDDLVLFWSILPMCVRCRSACTLILT